MYPYRYLFSTLVLTNRSISNPQLLLQRNASLSGVNFSESHAIRGRNGQVSTGIKLLRTGLGSHGAPTQRVSSILDYYFIFYLLKVNYHFSGNSTGNSQRRRRRRRRHRPLIHQGSFLTLESIILNRQKIITPLLVILGKLSNSPIKR